MLPDDLVARGFVLIVRAPGRVFAVSERYGGTHVCTNLQDVIRGARRMISYVEWREMKERENDADH